MGSGLDLQSAGLRRLIINAAYWGMEMESSITPTSSFDMVGTYEPRESGFNCKRSTGHPFPSRR